jgi:hypothetical protein
LQSITAKGRIWIKPSLTAVSNGASHRERNRFGMTEARSIFCSRAGAHVFVFCIETRDLCAFVDPHRSRRRARHR